MHKKFINAQWKVCAFSLLIFAGGFFSEAQAFNLNNIVKGIGQVGHTLDKVQRAIPAATEKLTQGLTHVTGAIQPWVSAAHQFGQLANQSVGMASSVGGSLLVTNGVNALSSGAPGGGQQNPIANLLPLMMML